MLQLQLLLPLLCLGPIATGLSLQNGTMLSGDGNAAGNVNLPTLGIVGLGNGSLSSAGINSGGSGGGGGVGGGIGMNLPLGGGGGGGVGSQSNQELSGSGNTLGTGGSGAGAGGAAGSSNNSALLQAPKEKQYERCTGPGDPGPCKQYIYKWRYEPSTSECTTFIWGGCDGNPHNRFSTEAECLYHCIGGPRKRIIEGRESIKSLLLSLSLPSSLADTLPPFLQSTTREPSTTESSLSSYTPSSAQLPGAGGYGAGMGIGGAGGGGAGGAGGGNSGVYGMGTTPVPIEQRGPELTFAETGQDKTFVFAKNNTFIQMDGDIIQTFQLR